MSMNVLVTITVVTRMQIVPTPMVASSVSAKLASRGMEAAAYVSKKGPRGLKRVQKQLLNLCNEVQKLSQVFKCIDRWINERFLVVTNMVRPGFVRQ